MYSQTDSKIRTARPNKGGAGIKALIMAASLAMTIGGWGILAVGQAGNALAAGQQALPATNSTSQNNTRSVSSTSSLSQSTASISRPNAVARTRSSR